MSLIQEALKRKQEEQLKTGKAAPLAAPPPAAPPPLAPPPADPDPDSGTGAKLIGVFVILFLLLGLAAGLFYLALQKKGSVPSIATMLGGETSQEAQAAAKAEPPAPAVANAASEGIQSIQQRVHAMKDAVTEHQKDVAEVESAQTQAPAPTKSVASTGPAEAADASGGQGTSETPAPPRPPSASGWPRITVNGVLANPNQLKAAAIINQRLITVNESVEGALILDIQPSGVTFEFKGEQRFVGMGQTIE